MALETFEQLIGGKWGGAADGGWLESVDPCAGQPWCRVPHGKVEDAVRAVDAASVAFKDGPWPRMTATARGALLRRVGDLIEQEADRLAEIETRDNGKLLSEMSAQVRYTAQWYYYYGGLADKIEGAVLPSDKPDMVNFTRLEPIGPVVAITAWNSPLLLAAYKVAPALAAGNTVVIKPSEHASASTLAFARLFEEAGMPPGVVNVVTGYGAEVGAALTKDPRIAKVTFTGGENIGREIAMEAGRNLRSTVLELGGKSPNIVFEDADMESAVNGAISGIFAASGQTCVAGSRLLLQSSIHDEFMDRLLAATKDIRVGNPLEAETNVGPIATRAQYERVLGYLDIAKQEGAECVRGGARADVAAHPDGWFVEPTIFTGVTNDMRIAREEVFGPVLSVLKFDDEEDAIAIANDSSLGLAAGVWTRDLTRAMTMTQRLQAGTVWVNTYRAVSFLSPFGGYKDSGIGRENGMDAIKQFLQVKSVWISTGGAVANPFVIR